MSPESKRARYRRRMHDGLGKMPPMSLVTIAPTALAHRVG